MSTAWTRFESDFLNASSWAQRKDGFPADLLDALTDSERARAIEVLNSRLDGRDDWPIRAMAHMGIMESLPQLRKLLQRHIAPSIRAVTATAIYELSKNSEMEDIVWAVASAKDKDWVHRLDAVQCLGRFGTQTAFCRLLELIDDSDYLISYNAKLAVGRKE